VHGIVTDTVVAAGISILICVVMGPFVIPLLRRLRAGQSIRDDGPKRHLAKAGTPTMGAL